MPLTKVSYSMIDGAVINLLDYGADPTGTDDSSAALTAAIAAAPTRGVVFVPAGQYRLDSQVNVSSVSIVGEGRATKFVVNVASGSVFLINATSSAQNTFYKDFWIHGNSTADRGFNVINTIGKILFENILFDNFSKAASVALRFGNSWSFDVVRCHFNSNVNDIAGQELTTELDPEFDTSNFVNEVVITSCKFELSTGTRISNAAGNGWSITENFFGGSCVDVIYFGGAATTAGPTFDNRVIGNDIEASPTNAVLSFVGNATVNESYNNNVCFNRITQNVNIFAGDRVTRTFFINNFMLNTLTGGKKQWNFTNSSGLELREPIANSAYYSFNTGAVDYLEQAGSVNAKVFYSSGGGFKITNAGTTTQVISGLSNNSTYLVSFTANGSNLALGLTGIIITSNQNIIAQVATLATGDLNLGYVYLQTKGNAAPFAFSAGNGNSFQFECTNGSGADVDASYTLIKIS